MKHAGYKEALDLGRAKLAELEPEKVAENTGVIWTGTGYEIPWLGKNVALEDGSEEERIIWYHYLATHGPKEMRNKYLAYRQVPGAAIYNSNFIKRCVDPMVKTFANDLDAFMEIGAMLGGMPAELGDAAFTINVLPYLPVTHVLYEGDDEFPANGNILFDETAAEWLCAEDLVVIASLPVYAMIGIYRKKS